MKVYIFFPINSFPVVSNLVSEKKKIEIRKEKETEKDGKRNRESWKKTITA